MSEEKKTTGPASEEPVVEETAADATSEEVWVEIGNLGDKVAGAIRSAWESDERRKAEVEIREALKTAGTQLDGISEDLHASEVAQDLKTQASRMVGTVEESQVTQEVRKGLLLGLHKLNEELNRLLNPSEEEPAEDAAQESTTD
ncbi:MAG: hypothetical protein U9R25_10880 [Chloroflexota bacterium]|nr:hypothetical protein [Chloroflexota bacterium]